jgi:ketosteroid isomerase-like protein
MNLNPRSASIVKNINRAAAAVLTLGVCFAMVLTLSCGSSGENTQAATDAIQQQMAKYTAALDAADLDLAAQVWRTSGDISLIHPGGHAHGWEEVKGFYKFFGSAFSERKLTARNVSVHVNGDTAWVEFYWHFTGKQGKDSSVVQTDGRETQVYYRAGNRWQLVHAHYSSPMTMP